MSRKGRRRRHAAPVRADPLPGRFVSGDDVGSELIFDEANPVAQVQPAFLQSLDLEDVRARSILQGIDRGIQVAMLLLQPRQLLAQLAFFFFGHRHRWFAKPAGQFRSQSAISGKLSLFGRPRSSLDCDFGMTKGNIAPQNVHRRRLAAILV
jgi:hypothetical protein